MFENAKVGDRVWNFLEGWGTIIELELNYSYPLRVHFDKYATIDSDSDSYSSYSLEGKYQDSQINPTLFWNEIKFDVPKKPKWRANEAETYFFISLNHSGELVCSESSDFYDSWSNQRFKLGNYYQTKEEVISLIGKINLLTKWECVE